MGGPPEEKYPLVKVFPKMRPNPANLTKNETLCAIWQHLYNFKNMKSTHGGVLLVVKLRTEVFFPLFKLYICYQISQSMAYFWARDVGFPSSFPLVALLIRRKRKEVDSSFTIEKTFEVIRFILIALKVVAKENQRANKAYGYRILSEQNFRFCELFAGGW